MPDFLKAKRRHAEAEVVSVRKTSPHRCCVTLGGPEVAAFLQAEGVDTPAAWVKVVLPSGEGRAYTIRRTDRSAGTLDLEFVLHAREGLSGPAAAWARQARPGDRISFAGPRDGGFRPPPDAAWLVLAGDATALPALQSIAEALPGGMAADMYVEIGSPADRQAVESSALLEVTWLYERSTPGRALRDALVNKPLPLVPGYVWLAGEAATMRALRTHYLERLGLARERLGAIGYWKLGEAAHRDDSF